VGSTDAAAAAGFDPGTGTGRGDDGALARTEHLVLDELSQRLDSVRLFREDDDARADAILEQFGAKGRVESDMLGQIGVLAPLAYPDRFEEAHRTAMHALEVFDRNAARSPSSLKAGFLQPVASFLVQLLVQLIVRDFQKSVIESIRRLYGRREASAVTGSPEQRMLRLARMQADRLAPGFHRESLGLPTFLFGGAVLSGIASALGDLLSRAVHSRIVLLVVVAVFLVVALGVFWCILQAAGIARRRTHIALDAPLRALWETIGAAGNPPKDESRSFATYAVLILVATLVIVPVAVTYAIRWA
jgi:hypothetical protein